MSRLGRRDRRSERQNKPPAEMSSPVVAWSVSPCVCVCVCVCACVTVGHSITGIYLSITDSERRENQQTEKKNKQISK